MDKVSIFQFPKDSEMHAKWIRMIPRQDLIVRDKMAVCKKHFSEQFIVRVDSAQCCGSLSETKTHSGCLSVTVSEHSVVLAVRASTETLNARGPSVGPVLQL